MDIYISHGYIFTWIYFRMDIYFAWIYFCMDIFSRGYIFAWIYFHMDIFSYGYVFAWIFYRFYWNLSLRLYIFLISLFTDASGKNRKYKMQKEIVENVESIENSSCVNEMIPPFWKKMAAFVNFSLFMQFIFRFNFS